MTAIDEAAEQCVEWALRTGCSGEAPPDQRVAVRARWLAGDLPRAPRTAMKHWPAVLVGAAGLLVAVGAALLVRFERPDPVTPAKEPVQEPTQEPPQDPQPAPPGASGWTPIASAADLQQLDPASASVRLLALWPDAIASLLARAPALERLDLGVAGKDPAPLTAADLQRLGGHQPLRDLRLTGRLEVEPVWLEPLAGLPALRTMVLPHVAVGDAGAAMLARLPVLQSLELAFDGTLGADGVASLATIAGLRELSLRGCMGLDAAALGKLGALKQLEKLDLDVCNGIALEWVPKLPPHLLATRESFLTAEILASGRGTGGVDDSVLQALAGCTRLREVRLLGCRAITRAGIGHLGKLPLRRLVLTVLVDGVAFVAALPPTLESLSLTHSGGLDDAALAALGKRLPLLRELDLMQCRAFTDAGLRALLTSVPLRRLDLRGCAGLTAEAVTALLAATSLEALDVSGARWVDQEAEAKLRAMPAMKEFTLRRGGVMMPR